MPFLMLALAAFLVLCLWAVAVLRVYEGDLNMRNWVVTADHMLDRGQHVGVVGV